MKKYFVILLLLSGTLYGQVFRPYHPIADSLLTKNIVGKKTSYTYQSFLFDIMGRQVKFKQNKKLIFSEEAPEGTRKIVPCLFESENSNDPMILITEQSSETLNGFNLYILNGLQSRSVGFFGLALNASLSAVNKKSPQSQSLIKYMILETDGTLWRISFNADELVVHPGTDREEVISGKEAKFIYNGKKLKEVKTF